jgi:hypothetical protein
MSYLWHFLREDRKLRYGDKREVRVGETLTVEFPIRREFHGYVSYYEKPTLCEAGLHASDNLLDALTIAPGPILCKVRLGDDAITDGDGKYVSSTRTVLAMANVQDIIFRFAANLTTEKIKEADFPREIIDELELLKEEELSLHTRCAISTLACRAARSDYIESKRKIIRTCLNMIHNIGSYFTLPGCSCAINNAAELNTFNSKEKDKVTSKEREKLADKLTKLIEEKASWKVKADEKTEDL